MKEKKRLSKEIFFEELDFFFHIIIIILVLASVFLLVVEFTFELEHETEIFIRNFDYFIIIVFSIDLFFEYLKIRDIKKFFKTCWLDIIAIVPISGFFRVLKISRVIRPFVEAKHLIYETKKVVKLKELIHLKHLKHLKQLRIFRVNKNKEK